MKHKYENYLWSRVDIGGPDDCWPWTGACASGNGVMTVGDKTLSTRRVAWESASEQSIPKDVHVQLTCQTTNCCNPAHMFLATLEERFKRGFKAGDPDSCWEWEKATAATGYGVLNRKGEIHLTHRLAWELANGPILDGLHVLHKCDNRRCVNPHHLFVGNQADNVQDMINKGREAIGAALPHTKLDATKVRKIRELLQLGVPATKIAQQFEVSRGAIMNIKHRRAWKHID